MPGTPSAITFVDNPVRSGPGFTYPRTYLVPVAASQTIYKGDIVSIASNVAQQSIALPGSNNTGTLSGGNLPVLGIANFAITTDSGSVWTQLGNFTESPGMLEVIILDDSTELALQLIDSVTSSHTISSLGLFGVFQFQRWRGPNATTWKYAITSTTTNGELRYIEAWAPNDQSSTTTFPWAWFKAILSATVRQGG